MEYSKIYKEQIEIGKSDIFAFKYAEKMAKKEYYTLSCYIEALEYESALNKGYSTLIAELISSELSELILNNYSSYEEALEDDFFNHERNRIEGSCKNKL